PNIPVRVCSQRLSFLDVGGRLAAVEVGGERHEARFRESIANLPKRLRQSPPRMQDQHTWSAAMLGNGQIGADRSPISLKFSHTALLKHSRKLKKRCASRSIAQMFCFVHPNFLPITTPLV